MIQDLRRILFECIVKYACHREWSVMNIPIITGLPVSAML